MNCDRFFHITYLNMKDTEMQYGRMIKTLHTLAQTKGHFLSHPEGSIMSHSAFNLKSTYTFFFFHFIKQ